MTITLNKFDLPNSIKTSSGNIMRVHDLSCSENQIIIPKEIGGGLVIHHNFIDAIELFVIHANLKEPLELHFKDTEEENLYISFCVEGQMVHFLEDDFFYEINNLSGVIAAPFSSKDQVITYQSNEKILISLIRINHEKYLNKLKCGFNDLPEEFKPLFSKNKNSLAHFTSYNLDCINCIYEIIENADTGMIRSAFVEAKTLELLFLQLKEYKPATIENPKKIAYSEADINRLIKAERVLLNNIKHAPTIPELARKVGLNQQKLKKGFKELYGKTIYNYLRDERLRQAERLISKNQYSIQQIANIVGYSNASHFARRFKEKYGHTPKAYKKQVFMGTGKQ